MNKTVTDFWGYIYRYTPRRYAPDLKILCSGSVSWVRHFVIIRPVLTYDMARGIAASLIQTRLDFVNYIFIGTSRSNNNKCIGYDTKAAARQSLNCIKTKKIKYGEKRFSVWRMKFLHPAMWHDHDINFVR